MYNLDVDVPKEDLHNAIVQELRLLGLKNGLIPKRISKTHQSSKSANGRGHVFRKPLHHLSSRIVQLQTGVEAEVPNIIQEMCCCIVKEAGLEGLFRKAGSTARQKEIKAVLDQGHKIQLSQHHVIDVANILTYFLRELPEPVLPYSFHDLFLHCLLLDDTAGAVLLVCLLLPRPHLHVLAYLMEFLHLIAGLSESNKMNVNNLATVVALSLMPVSDKVSVIQNPQRVTAHIRIVEVLISNAERIGVLPDGVVGKLSLTPSVSSISLLSDDQTSGSTFSTKKKRRRSGSLTRMFNGLKKIVAGKPSPGTETDCSGLEEESALVPTTTDFSTPCVKSAKKRKALDATSAFSSKKKREVLMALPQSTALADTPFKKNSTAAADSNETPRVCPHPNPSSNHKSKSKSPQKNKNRKFFPTRTYSESDNRKVGVSAKKGLSGVSNFVIKKQKIRADRHSTSGNFLERSWSAVSSSSWGRKKMQQSDRTRLSVLSTSSAAYALVESDSSHDADMGIDLSQEDPFDTSPSDFVHVPKSEYEDLKSRLSAIESCISQEFSSVSSSEVKASPDALNAANTPLAVQNVYEKTLEDADIARDSSTDQLAKRLSRELKIRRSTENKVIRSPSARKIGSIRRRSRERQSPALRRELRRNKSWHMMQRPVVVPVLTRGSSEDTASAQCSRLRRGRPNTVFSGLPHPTPNRISKDIRNDDIIPILGADNSPVTRSQARRASSFHGSEMSSPVHPSSKKCRSQVNLAKAALLAHAQQKSKGNMEQDEKWRDAKELLSSSNNLLSGVPTTGRESIAKLRSENAGKVLATAKLFNGNVEPPKQLETRRSRAHETGSARASLGNNPEEASEKLITENKQSSKVENVTEKHDVNFQSVPVSRMPPTKSASSNARKLNGEKSPGLPSRTRKLKVKTSPTRSPTVRQVSGRVKKHSSMKTDRVVHSQPVRRNLSVPVQLIDSGKENQVDKSIPNIPHFTKGISPQGAKESVPLTERTQRVSVSPLKDCNRISVQPLSQPAAKFASVVPCTTPNIKQPLTALTPRRKAFTPQSARGYVGNTPLKVMATPLMTPIQSSLHRSSRLQHSTKASGRNPRTCN